MWRTLGALAAVIALALFAASVTKRIAARRGGILMALGPAGRAPAGIVHVLARYPLQRGQLLVLMKVGPRVLLVSQSRGGRLAAPAMTTLAQFTDADEVAQIVHMTQDSAGESMSGKFQSVLEKAGILGGAGPAAASDAEHELPRNSELARRMVAGDDGDHAELSERAERMSSSAPAARPPRRVSRPTGYAPRVEPAPMSGRSHPEVSKPFDGAEILRQRLARLRTGGAGDQS